MIVELLIFVIFLAFWLHKKKRDKFPPGPFSLPIIGTVSLYKKGNRATDYPTYGDMTSFFIGPQTVMIMINDFQLSKDLFSKDEFSGE